jgi:hypothetical protein
VSGDGPRRRPARILYGVAVIAALILAFLNCRDKYGVFETWTKQRTGNLWPDGRPVASDFIQYAAVAEAWERGRIDELYASLGRQQEFMTLAADLPKHVNYVLSFNYPPFVAWLLRPLAPLDYMERLVAWSLMQGCFLLAALWCWSRELPPRAFGVVAAAFLLSPSVVGNVTIGQASFMGLAFMSGTLLLLDRERDFSAGLVLSLLFYKPTLGIVIGPLVVAAGRWRVVSGVAVGGSLLAAASAAVSIEACKDFPKIGRELFIMATSHPDYYSRHFNWLGAVATLLGKTPDEFNWVRRAVVVIPIAILFLTTARAWCSPWRPGTARWQAGASAAVLTTLVATPYLFAYDTVLVGVAAVYSVKTWNVRPEWHRWFVLGSLVAVGYCVARDAVLLNDMRDRWPVRLQPTPFVLAAWAMLEARWAISTERRPSDG